MAARDRRGDERKLPRTRRLTRGSEIRAVLARGKRSRTAHLDVWDSASPVACSRAGVIVPRYRHTVVERNRLKRRLREILRTEVLPRLRALDAKRDILVRARPEAYSAQWQELRAELVQWLERAWPSVSS